MGRYRTPQKPGSPYITAKGAERLRTELKELWKKRREVTAAVTAAAAEGDRSENAEYIYRKKQLREIDRRVRYLTKRIEVLKVVDTVPSDPTKIFFGAYVTVEGEAGEESEYRIVGPDEFDPKKDWISMDSPVARALMKKGIDDEIEVDLPKGKGWLIITAIRYDADA